MILHQLQKLFLLKIQVQAAHRLFNRSLVIQITNLHQHNQPPQLLLTQIHKQIINKVPKQSKPRIYQKIQFRQFPVAILTLIVIQHLIQNRLNQVIPLKQALKQQHNLKHRLNQGNQLRPRHNLNLKARHKVSHSHKPNLRHNLKPNPKRKLKRSLKLSPKLSHLKFQHKLRINQAKTLKHHHNLIQQLTQYSDFQTI